MIIIEKSLRVIYCEPQGKLYGIIIAEDIRKSDKRGCEVNIIGI